MNGNYKIKSAGHSKTTHAIWYYLQNKYWKIKCTFMYLILAKRIPFTNMKKALGTPNSCSGKSVFDGI